MILGENYNRRLKGGPPADRARRHEQGPFQTDNARFIFRTFGIASLSQLTP